MSNLNQRLSAVEVRKRNAELREMEGRTADELEFYASVGVWPEAFTEDLSDEHRVGDILVTVSAKRVSR